jgi:hypothetical protein
VSSSTSEFVAILPAVQNNPSLSSLCLAFSFFYSPKGENCGNMKLTRNSTNHSISNVLHTNTTTSNPATFTTSPQDSSTIQQIAFGIVGIFLTLATVYLAYMQLQRMRHPVPTARSEEDTEMGPVQFVVSTVTEIVEESMRERYGFILVAWRLLTYFHCRTTNMNPGSSGSAIHVDSSTGQVTRNDGDDNVG